MAYGYIGERALVKRQTCPRCSGSVLGGECVTCGRSVSASGLVTQPEVGRAFGKVNSPQETVAGVYDPRRMIARQ